MFQGEALDEILEVMEPLIFDTDKYKQRAGGEIFSGLIRGLFLFYQDPYRFLKRVVYRLETLAQNILY